MAAGGVVGGVPGGVPGGPGGVIGGIIGGIPSAAPPPPPVKEVKGPSRIRVGGNVQAANLIKKVTPAYPPLAKQARIQGVVRFTAIIGKDGTIQNLQLVTGHPLLVPSATEAVKQWIYKPTLLNGEPVEVITQIDVNFTLSQ
jgi:protein TonB